MLPLPFCFLFVLNGVVFQKNCVGLAEAYETEEPQQQSSAEHDGGRYRAFVTSIQCPINISEAHSNSLSEIWKYLALMEKYWLREPDN